MNETELEIPGVKVFSPRVFDDDRGFLFESFRASWLPGFDFVQDNHSQSVKGTLRGLHYQLENPQGKLVRVTAGEVFDVVVDLRRDSPGLGQWHGVTLSGENHTMLWVPPGFAHGFYVTSDYADFQYKCTDIYHPGSEISLAWDDPTVGIEWPIPEGEAPQLSAKDRHGSAWGEIPLL